MAEPGIAATPCCCGSVFFLLAGAALAYAGGTQYLLVQKIANTPTSKVRSVAVGLAELFGKAKCAEEMLSPVSKAKCVFHRFTAEWYEPPRGKRSGQWHTFINRRSSKRFYLEDDTGRMLIEPEGAEVHIPSDFSSTGHLSDKALFGLLPQKQLDKKILDYLEQNPEDKKAFEARSGHRLRATEYFIAEGDPLYVLGTATPQEGVSGGAQHERLVMMKGKNEKIMFISDSGEKNFSGNMKLSAIAFLLLGLSMSAASLIIILLSVFAIAL